MFAYLFTHWWAFKRAYTAINEIIFFQVNEQVSNKSALHFAVDANKLNVLKIILKFNPKLEITVMQQIYFAKASIIIVSNYRMKLETHHSTMWHIGTSINQKNYKFKLHIFIL